LYFKKQIKFCAQTSHPFVLNLERSYSEIDSVKMASKSDQLVKSNITLRGSTKIVTEFFGYAINSILYQRAIYPEEMFEPKKEYNLQIMVTKDKTLQQYLNNILIQLQQWLLKGEIQKFVLVIASIDDGTPLERWVFNVETDQTKTTRSTLKGKSAKKSMKEIRNEIRGIIRQITSSVTFLPLLEVPCSFEILAYTDKDSQVPSLWQESAPKLISNSESVRLRSFDTKIHRVDAMVSYKVIDDDEEEDEDEVLYHDENTNSSNVQDDF